MREYPIDVKEEQEKRALIRPIKRIMAKQMILLDEEEMKGLWVETSQKGPRKWIMDYYKDMTTLRRVPLTCMNILEAQKWLDKLDRRNNNEK